MTNFLLCGKIQPLHMKGSFFMSQQLIDITGNEYNYFTVLGFSHIGHRRHSYWKVQCKCGKILTLRKSDFAYASSRYKSCGCWHREESRQRANRNRDKKTGRICKEKEVVNL